MRVETGGDDEEIRREIGDTGHDGSGHHLAERVAAIAG